MSNWDVIKKRCYVAYSGRVSVCIVRGKSGVLYPGVRIENASFPLTITATQAGIFSCISEGDDPVELYHPDESGDEYTNFFSNQFKIPAVLNAPYPEGKLYEVSDKSDDDIRNKLKSLHSFCLINESHFAVSALIRSNDKQITGVNIEFEQWHIGLCAERVAIAKAISNGIQYMDEIHITASKGDFISPCGACRQVLVEFMPYKNVHLYHPDGTASTHVTANLLPGFFNGDTIKK